MSKPIAFIIGAGKNIGAGVANALQSKGYRVALAARSLKQEETTGDRLHLTIDLSNPDSVTPAFNSLRKQWGEPSVVFYNAAAAHFTSGEEPFATSVSDYALDLTINNISLYAAIKEAVTGFDKLGSSLPRTFAYTGNILNTKVMPASVTLGVGKAASSHVVELADTVYSKKGYGFFFVDERKADGSSKGTAIDGPAHGEFVASLVENTKEVPWHATFVAGEGYVKFPRSQL